MVKAYSVSGQRVEETWTVVKSPPGESTYGATPKGELVNVEQLLAMVGAKVHDVSLP